MCRICLSKFGYVSIISLGVVGTLRLVLFDSDTEVVVVSARDYEGVKQAIARLCQATDGGDYDKFVAMFVEDAVFYIENHSFRGHEGLRHLIEVDGPPGIAPDRRYVHIVVNPVIDFDGDERAKAVSDFIVLGWFGSRSLILAGGKYYDTLVAVGDRWLFAERGTILNSVPKTEGWDAYPGSTPLAEMEWWPRWRGAAS